MENAPYNEVNPRWLFFILFILTPAGLGLELDHYKKMTDNNNENACTTYIFITAYDHITIM